MYQSVKWDFPNLTHQGGIAGLMRDFRVDEDHTMSHALDPRLEGLHPHLQLVDRITNL